MSYFSERMSALSANPEDFQGLFLENPNGDIQIKFISLNGEYVTVSRGNDTKTKPYVLTRLHPDRVNGRKYIRPRRDSSIVSAYPWFTTGLIDKFRRKAQIETLFMTEGVFKAFSGGLQGLDIIGIQGIQNYSIKEKKEFGKEVRKLDPEIEQLLTDCRVRNFVFLMDADCRDIDLDADNPRKDLYMRPNDFYTAIRNFREICKPYNVDIYFAHIRKDIGPKGLDDLYQAYPEKKHKITRDLKSLQNNEWAEMMNITALSLGKIKDYFKITSPEGFYSFHQETLADGEFVFKRTTYKWNDSYDRLDVIRAKEADMFIRVGDDYIKRVEKPNRHGRKVPTLTAIKKQTILDDYKEIVPNIIKMIEKYEGFIVAPEHIHYQAILDGWLNEYKPFLHEAIPGECETSLEFIKHIFGSFEIEWQGRKVPMWEFGLDYIQLLYQKPRQILPVLILVSQENQTGKGTFKNWLRFLFGENSTEVTVDELDDKFNDGYATKVLIVIDEALVDRAHTKERLKYLSTNDSIKINPKGLKRYEVDFFGKFILISNNEESCIPIEKSDDRFWVHKVSKPKTNNVHLFEELKEEVPAFLYFLQKRKMVCPKKETRNWFPHEIIYTPARERMIQYNRTFLEKAIIEVVRSYFIALISSEERHPDGALHRDIEQIALDRQVFISFLKENNYRNWTPHMITDTLKKKFDGVEKRKNSTFEYPVIDENLNLDEIVVQRISWNKKVNEHFIFNRSEFISPEELAEYLQDESKGEKPNVGLNVPF